MYLQLGVFSHFDNAQKFSRHINSLLTVHQNHISRKLKNGQQQYYVRIGPLNNTEQINEVAYALQQKGITQHYIVVD